MNAPQGPLAGITVLDFSSLLPGPLATLLLAEAGAEVVKVERPPGGDPMRARRPKLGSEGAVFSLLNRGKRSVAVDLKDPRARDQLSPMLDRVDVVVEQFRPGVMDRLGLGYDDIRAINPRVIYCSIVGYAAADRRALKAGHDLNYVAESGLLSLVPGLDGSPGLPHAMVGDIAGGSLPAVINILLALRQRDLTGTGARIEIAMADNLDIFLYAAAARGWTTGAWPQPGEDVTTGGSPRYGVYRTADDRHIAAAPIEEKFWSTFCDAIGLAPEHRNDRTDPERTRREIAAILRTRSAEDWEHLFEGRDVCCSVVLSPAEALGRNDADRRRHLLTAEDNDMPALPVPIDEAFRRPGASGAPSLGEASHLLRSAG